MTPSPVGTSTGSSSPNPRTSDAAGQPVTSDVTVPAAPASGEPTPEDPPGRSALPVETPAPATTGGPTSRAAAVPAARSLFPYWMTAVVVVAGAIQLAFIHAMSRRAVLGAAGEYDTVQAHYLVRGQWFIDPLRAASGAHLLVPTAAHPPLPTLLLGIADVASATDTTAHMVFLAVVFVASVLLAGITVRDLVGERAGVVAALALATFPLLWVNPATVGPETTVIAVTTLLLFGSVRYWARPSPGHAALVGLALGLCALTRTDLVALVVLVGLPLGLLVHGVSWKVRLRALAVMGVVALLVVGPWVGRNLSLFGHTVVLSQDYGPVVAGANCDVTASGQLEGWWSPTCLARVPATGQDPSVTTADQLHVGRVYVADHLTPSVGVAAVRLGRVWNVYRPLQGADLEVGTGRPVWVSRLGLWYFYALVPVAVVGALVLRRRHLLMFPFVALILLSSVTAVLAFGDARFAVEADVALAMLAGVGLDALATRARRRWTSGPGLHSSRRVPVTP